MPQIKLQPTFAKLAFNASEHGAGIALPVIGCGKSGVTAGVHMLALLLQPGAGHPVTAQGNRVDPIQHRRPGRETIGGAKKTIVMAPALVGLLTERQAAAPLAPGVVCKPVSYTHLRAHETRHDLVCRLLLEK